MLTKNSPKVVQIFHKTYCHLIVSVSDNRPPPPADAEHLGAPVGQRLS